MTNPRLVADGNLGRRIIQGQLYDHGLLAAMTCLTLHSGLLYEVVPRDQSFGEDYAGIFHFRFWYFGQWTDVVVDDRLPCRNDELLFCHSSENEVWASLVEKAYAKYASYCRYI